MKGRDFKKIDQGDSCEWKSKAVSSRSQTPMQEPSLPQYLSHERRG